jgi:hypothetical protein
MAHPKRKELQNDEIYAILTEYLRSEGLVGCDLLSVLREILGLKKGKKIPVAKLKKAEHSKNPKTAKRAHLTETLKKMHK